MTLAPDAPATASSQGGQIVEGGLVACVDPRPDPGEVTMGEERVVTGRRTPGGQHVDLHVVGCFGQLACEPMPPGDLERDPGDLPRSPWRPERTVDPADLQHEDAIGSQGDRASQWDGVDDAPVQEVLVAHPGRGQQTRYGGAGPDGVEGPAGGGAVVGR